MAVSICLRTLDRLPFDSSSLAAAAATVSAASTLRSRMATDLFVSLMRSSWDSTAAMSGSSNNATSSASFLPFSTSCIRVA